MSLQYREMQKNEAAKIAEIDRSELIDGFYVMQDGEMVLKPANFDVQGWHPGHLLEVTEAFEQVCDEGGTAWGAYDGERLVGMSALSGDFMPTGGKRLQMKLLYVSKHIRGQGVARQLMELCKQRARELGAKSLYVSATETKSTVDAYMRLGCVLTKEIDPEQFKEEPRDIHLEMKL